MYYWNSLREFVPRMRKYNSRVLASFFLTLIAVVLFSGSLSGPFLWDDVDVIHDPAIHSISQIPSFFVERSEPPREFDLKTLGQVSYYRPVTKSLIALEYAFFGENPVGYHCVSLLLNAALGVLIFLLIELFSRNRKLAFWASLLMLVNPARGEAVHWIYSVSSLTEGVFALGSFYFYLRRRTLLSASLFLLALMSRESSIQLVFVLLAFEFCREPLPGERGVRARLARTLPFWGVAFLFLWIRFGIVGELPPLSKLPWVTFFNTAAVVFARLWKLCLWPDSAVALYRLRTFENFSFEVVCAWFWVFSYIGIFIWLFKRKRELAFWWLWPLAWIVLQFNIGGQGEGLLAEKHMYLAWAGPSVIIAAFLLRYRYGLGVLLIACGLYASVTVWRSSYWTEKEKFFKAVLDFEPEYWQARYALAMDLGERGEYPRAKESLLVLLEKQPRNSPALNGVGNCFFALGDRSSAIAYWRKALEADPNNAIARSNLERF